MMSNKSPVWNTSETALGPNCLLRSRSGGGTFKFGFERRGLKLGERGRLPPLRIGAAELFAHHHNQRRGGEHSNGGEPERLKNVELRQ
jgi:hypothetical protein